MLPKNLLTFINEKKFVAIVKNDIFSFFESIFLAIKILLTQILLKLIFSLFHFYTF